MPAVKNDIATEFKYWANVAALLETARNSKLQQMFASVRPLIAAINVVQQQQAHSLGDLLRKSEQRLHPLCDPLMVDLGVHRWLRNKREENYSDWLEWVLRQIPSAVEVFFLLGSKPVSRCEVEPEFHRELPVPEGHAKRAGRLDLAVRYPKVAVRVIEVKIGGADDCDSAKHAGYKEWLEQQSEPDKEAILIATEGRDSQYVGFRLLKWRDFCIRLRSMLPDLTNRRGISVAAMVAGFISAVEQNLLGLPHDPLKVVAAGRIIALDQTVDYLREATGSEDLSDVAEAGRAP